MRSNDLEARIEHLRFRFDSAGIGTFTKFLTGFVVVFAISMNCSDHEQSKAEPAKLVVDLARDLCDNNCSGQDACVLGSVATD